MQIKYWLQEQGLPLIKHISFSTLKKTVVSEWPYSAAGIREHENEAYSWEIDRKYGKITGDLNIVTTSSWWLAFYMPISLSSFYKTETAYKLIYLWIVNKIQLALTRTLFWCKIQSFCKFILSSPFADLLLVNLVEGE